MRKRVGKKKGDTLIEVALAVGIFSMVAIAIVSIMNSGSSNSQTALETTLAREEIDSQAEAIRFIHAAYIADRGNNNSPYVKTWKDITTGAISGGSLSSVLEYAPTNCGDIYQASNANFQNAFIINTRNLGADNPNAVVIKAKNSASTFQAAGTYPRLLFSGDSANLFSTAQNTNLSRAEGIFDIVVRDVDGTTIIGSDGSDEKPAYFDFYIRTCWYGAGSDTPSTISTVIRLYDPDAIQGTVLEDDSRGQVKLNLYYLNGSHDPNSSSGRKIRLIRPSKENRVFYGWCDRKPINNDKSSVSCPGNTYEADTYLTNSNENSEQIYNLYAMWGIPRYTIQFDANGSSWVKSSLVCGYFDRDCIVDDKADNGNPIPRGGFRFDGWCLGTVSGTSCNGTKYASGSDILPYLRETYPSSSATVTLRAIWVERNETITILATWTSNNDYDSHLYLQKPDDTYQSANYATTGINVTYSGRTYSLITGYGDGRGSHNNIRYEKFVINTLGGKNYYYSIRNWDSPGNIGNDITVTVSGDYMGTETFRSTARSNCEYWNVFAYKDGEIVRRNTCSSTMETNY